MKAYLGSNRPFLGICLDVGANDRGNLAVIKGDQYDVRENGAVRNLGLPVELARHYYQEGADEITFLNITASKQLTHLH